MGNLCSIVKDQPNMPWIQSDTKMPVSIYFQEMQRFKQGKNKWMMSDVEFMENKYNLQLYEFPEFMKVDDVEKVFENALKPFYPEYLYQISERGYNLILTMLVKPIEKYHPKMEGEFSQLVKFLDRIHFLKLIFKGLYEENIYHQNERIVVVGLHSLTNNKNISKINNYNEALKMPPESIQQGIFDQAGDWWCLGALIYFYSQKELPFQNENKSMDQHLKDKTENYRNLSFKKEIKEDEKNIILSLLNPDSTQRLQFANKIKEDNYFKSIDWQRLQKLSSQFRLK